MRSVTLILLIFTLICGESRIEFLPGKEVNTGIVLRDTLSDALHFNFTVKNSGSDTLVLKRVKPTCGCTIVDHDNIIAPGGSGSIKATIKKSKINDGGFSKAIKIYSNAANDSMTTLFLKGRIVSYVTSSLHYIRILASEDSPAKSFLRLSTPMSNLQVQSISFVPKDDYDASLDGDFSLTSNGKDSDGYYIYTLNFSFNVRPSDYLKGEFVIETNCKKMRTIRIRGMIVPPNN